ncbi:hypothetical protein MAALD49_34830 [Marinobacter shengliensis]|nr:hypothetical protein MAALD49_34830 [Marinobacter shengliensis]
MDGRSEAHMDVLVAFSGKGSQPMPNHQTDRLGVNEHQASTPNSLGNQAPSLVEISRRQTGE